MNKSTITLNIGLNRNTGEPLPVHLACASLAARFTIMKSRVALSPAGDEQTLVAVVARQEFYRSQAYLLACELSQDCIAVSTFELIGPEISKWVPFHPDFFVDF